MQYAARIQEIAHRAPEEPFRRFGFKNLSPHGHEMREEASGATRPHSNRESLVTQ